MTTIGFAEFQQKLNNLEPKTVSIVSGFVEDAGLFWEQRAKLAAPVNFGTLRANITSRMSGKMQSSVTSPVLYSPYVEWGTGTRVSVPSELAGYALQFKGVRETLGRYPKPYFFVQKPLVEKQLFDDIKTYLTTQQ